MTPGRAVFLASLLASVALALALVPRDPAGYTAAVAALGALAAAGLFAPERASKSLLALGVLNLLLVVPELALRLARFQHVSGVQFGYPTPELFWELVPDEELFWRLPTEDPLVNSLGFLGPEPAAPKPGGAFRVLFLGDSCSQQGHPEGHPEIAGHLLREAGVAAEVVNLSMAGYSTHQGRVLARAHAARLAPDLAVVYYGWNDHWLAYGAADRDKAKSVRREALYRRLRLLQGLRALAERAGLAGGAEPLDVPRVPPDHYRENLEAIVASIDAPVVLVTAPTAHRRLGVPDYLVEEGFARDAASVLALHEDYNRIAREVAGATGARLFDADAAFEHGEDLRAAFLEDGIHLSEAGRWAFARRLVDFLRREGLVPEAGG